MSMEWRSNHRLKTNWKERLESIQNNRPQVDEELFKECLRYTFAFRKEKRVYRNERFPECLTESTSEKKENVIKMLKVSKSLGEVSEKMGIPLQTVQTIVYYYEDALQFYAKWKVFWEFIQPIREQTVEEMLKDFFTQNQISRMKKKGTVTMEDYFNVYLKNRDSAVWMHRACHLKNEKTERIYEHIFRACCDLLKEQESRI